MGWISKLFETQAYEDKKLTKEEIVELVKNGMTVGELIDKLEQFDKNLVVINESNEDIPVNSVRKSKAQWFLDDSGNKYYQTEVVFIN